MKSLSWLLLFTLAWASAQTFTDAQLKQLLKRFPAADTNQDKVLSPEEARAFREKARKRGGVKRVFQVDPGWDAERFPSHAACYKTPAELKQMVGGRVPSHAKRDGVFRVVGTGHSFMAPGYKTLPRIGKLAGFDQPLHTHTGGGMTGSARYKWEQENGIFQFDGQATPKLLAALANAEWDAMMWGPYYKHRPVYYKAWMDFALKYNPAMTFYLSDAWPQLEQFEKAPASESELTAEAFRNIGDQKNRDTRTLVDTLNKAHPGKVFVVPTSDAMVLAVQAYHEGKLPGIEGISRPLGGKERSLWRDRLGHLGPGLEWLEGYVFYATLYGKPPADIAAQPKGTFPGPTLDAAFRKIAWEAVVNHPLSGVSKAKAAKK